jgi:eukaryotic-like serine/threonine-protein kinase
MPSVDSTPAPMPFAPGTVLVGKYRVERQLGQGGMGWVILATHIQLEQRVAIKFMHASHLAHGPDSVARFLREARAAARIQSEHVARVADVGTLEDGSPYLVMEYLEGQDLDALLRTRHALPIALAVEYAVQACEGLAEAHAAGIVHRDLKPANLFLARRTDGSVRVKLLDFGISKLMPVPGGAADVAMTSTQALMGSPLYMAPEQMRSSKNVDKRADIWSMGVILYQMFGGRAPFDAETLPEVCARIMTEAPAPLHETRTEVTPELEAVVLRCLEKDASRRYQDVGALAKALAPFGPPETRSAADRVGRLVRATASSLPDIPGDMTVAAPAGLARSSTGIAQTSATFAASASALRRSRTRTIAVGSGMLALGLAGALAALVSLRGRSEGTPSHAASGATGVAIVTAPASASAPAPAPASAPASAPAPASASAPALPTLKALKAAGQTPARAITKPAGPSSAKPAATSAFGGRD